LALALVEAAHARGQFARLVGDDRIVLQRAHGRLIARPHAAIAGRVERRGQGIGGVSHEGAAVVRCLVDLGPAVSAADAPARMPPIGAQTTALEGVDLPRLVIPAGLAAAEGARLVLDYLVRRGL
ncbi:MAG: serine/threonine protein kinase, partial [Beijerinckiaceae bacterium]|nr:serine/threonine protein kinase [Beijerinckiaceae bacterium]